MKAALTAFLARHSVQVTDTVVRGGDGLEVELAAYLSAQRPPTHWITFIAALETGRPPAVLVTTPEIRPVPVCGGGFWMLLIFGLPLVMLGAFIALIIWLVRLVSKPRIPATA